MTFEPLTDSIEEVGIFKGIIFYDASISTDPEATIEHLRSLGSDVRTVILGGFDEGADFSELGNYIVESSIQNVILFPTTGNKIWKAIVEASRAKNTTHLPKSFTITEKQAANAMEFAVRVAYKHTPIGKICLHSPASPSSDLFKDYQERGRLFREYVNKLGSIPNLTPLDEEYWECDWTGEE